MTRNRWLRVVGTVVVTGLATAYIVSQVDLGRTGEILGSTDPWWLALAVALMFVTMVPMAWRWQILLRARGIHDRLGWLLRAYFVSYAVGQILPTSVGGDASRIFETARRHPGQVSPIAGSVLIERALGGAVTLALAGVGFLLAIGHYDIGPYLWVEALFVLLTIGAGFVFFSRRVRRWLRFALPVVRRLRLETPVRAVYEGIHGYRDHVRTLVVVCGATLVVQVGRIFAIWAAGKAVGVDISARPYFVLGPLLFLVMLVPFTINGLAVREAFFVSFLGRIGVDADAAFAVGFLFFLLTVAIALPGLAVILWEGVRRAAPAAVQRDA
jgi:uncharacterized protein (TIRG00374 family)